MEMLSKPIPAKPFVRPLIWVGLIFLCVIAATYIAGFIDRVANRREDQQKAMDELSAPMNKAIQDSLRRASQH